MEQLICYNEDLTLSKLYNVNLFAISEKIESRQVFYRYPQANTIIQTILLPIFLRADKNTNDRGTIYFLYGDYHTGKSFLLKFFSASLAREFPEYWRKYEQPILHFDLNNHINTANQLLVFLLEKLGRPVDGRIVSQWQKEGLAKERLQFRLISTLERLGTRILILDECQKLLIARNPDLCDIFELLKDLCTKKNWSGELRTQIILCGTKDGLPLLDTADWIQGRTRTIRLLELNESDFYTLLISIYRDYTNEGISKEWDLMQPSLEENKYLLNSELAMYLYARTGGKVGFTVDLIRSAVLFALDKGRLYPMKEDYEGIQLDHKTYIMHPESSPSTIVSKKEKRKIRITLHDRLCKIEDCIHSKKSYTRYSALIDHYKKKHPNIELNYEEDK